jgi:hypothetical protein
MNINCNILAICLLLFFISCNNQKHNNQNVSNAGKEDILIATNRDTTEFEKFLSLIPFVKLPIDFYCGIDNYTLVENYNFEHLNKFLPNEIGLGIVGRFSNGKDKESIIYVIAGDMLYPYLYVYNGEGTISDSLYLHIGYCSGDDSVITSNKTVINQDFSINMVDTTKHIHFEDNNIIADSIIVTRRDLYFSTKGKYVIESEKTMKL